MLQQSLPLDEKGLCFPKESTRACLINRSSILMDEVFLWYKVGADKNLLVKDHTHTFINKGSEIGGLAQFFFLLLSSPLWFDPTEMCIKFVELDFRFPVGAPIHGIRAFLITNQLKVWSYTSLFLVFTVGLRSRISLGEPKSLYSCQCTFPQ